MDINDLKKAWDQYSSNDGGKELDENDFRKMLRGRTKNLIERIERNIKIGFFVILLLILFFILDDFIISPILAKKISPDLEAPQWMLIMNICTNLLIIVTFIFFVYKYSIVKKQYNLTLDLNNTLKKIIKTLYLYERLFFYTVVIILFSSSVNIITGMYMGFLTKAQEEGLLLNEIKLISFLPNILLGLVFLIIISCGLFLLFRWGFRRLYGNYLQKLELTLKELKEID